MSLAHTARIRKLKTNSIFKLPVLDLRNHARSEPTCTQCGVSSSKTVLHEQFCPQYRKVANLAALSATMMVSGWLQFKERISSRKFHAHRLSTIVEASYKFHPRIDLLSFIRSTWDELEGPYHCWLNRFEKSNECTGQEGAYLVIALRFLDHYIFEKVKLLKQRFPQLIIMGFHSVHSPADQSQLIKLFMNEYIVIPILLSKKQFSLMENGSFCILFNNLKKSVSYTTEDLDLGILNKEIEDMLALSAGNSTSLSQLMNPSWKPDDVIRDSYVSPLRNLVLNYPGCISADDKGNHLFLSDCNHHRIIIFGGDGRILDCIGSSPGFEDGDFGSAKLMRPAASYYDSADDSLYFVDSENHAIRKADIGGRMVETLYPLSSMHTKTSGLWAWIQNKLGLEMSWGNKKVEKSETSEDKNSKCLMFPWHLMKSEDGAFLILNQSLQTLWIMDLTSTGVIEAVQGSQQIFSICGQHIMEKINLLKEIPYDCLRQQCEATCSVEGLPHAGLLSSITALQNHVIISDAAGQRIWKMDKSSMVWSNLQLSNFGILGLPYWATSPLEKFYAGHNGASEIDHLESFKMLPGRIDIQIYLDIPVDTELVEPLEEACIWCQARGAATEISAIEDDTGSFEKVGIAQQFYDELDKLAFSPPEPETVVEDETVKDDSKLQDERIRFSCAVNTSPGKSEVIIYAVLHLKLGRDMRSQEENQEKHAARIANIMMMGKSAPERDLCAALLLNSGRDLRDLIFLKPLHVRVKLDCLDHPKAENSRDIILTDSSIDVNVSLNS